MSPDTVVPGNADGSLDGIALTPLTVAFHEPGFIATLQQENQQPFWFMMSAAQRQRAGNPMGPANPQALNRYAYTQNNPVRYTDPSGHFAQCDPALAGGPPVAGACVAIVFFGTLAVWAVGQIIIGEEIDRQQAIEDQRDNPDALHHDSRWRDRDSDVGPVEVRRLRGSEVPREAHRRKGKGNPLGADDHYYVDRDGRLFSGNENGELTYEGQLKDYRDDD